MARADITNKIALVTGASRGIGREIVQDLLEAGAYVIAASKKSGWLSNLSKEYKKYSDKFIYVQVDLGVPSGVQILCRKIKKMNLTPDIIVNNAGVFYFKTLENSTERVLRESFEVNVFSPFFICHKFVPAMKIKKWGRIINICSSSAYTGGGVPGHCVYSATKHALLGFSRALDEEVRKDNIRIGTVSPAGVATDMLVDRVDLDQSTLMSASDVAEAVMYQITSDSPGILYEMRFWRMRR